MAAALPPQYIADIQISIYLLPTYIISNCYTTALMTNKATDDEIIIMKEVANADIHLLHGSS